MKAVIALSDGRCAHLFSDDAVVSLTADKLESPILAFGVSTATHEVVTVPEPPSRPHNAYGWISDAWVVLNQEKVDAALGLAKAELKEKVNAIRDEKLALGYPHDFGPPHGVKTLDTRTEIDRTNWLGAGQLCSAQIMEGNGAVAGATFRTSDNTNITLTFQDALSVILSMGVYTGSILSTSWSLKDQIEAAPDHTALAAIDITAGWP
jgi:hypothetical protein